jgi:hypothetical protein
MKGGSREYAKEVKIYVAAVAICGFIVDSVFRFSPGYRLQWRGRGR